MRDRGEFDGNGIDPGVRTMLTGGGFDSECRVYERTRPNGVVLEVRSMPTPDGGMVRTFTDITERKRAEARIAEMATHDELTGLANRSLFRERVEQALNRTQRYGEPFALLMLDLDRFKPINDTLGHPVGDKVLKETALRLQFCVRETDTVARLGGDEFAILQAEGATQEEVRISRNAFWIPSPRRWTSTVIASKSAPPLEWRSRRATAPITINSSPRPIRRSTRARRADAIAIASPRPTHRS